MEELLQSLTWGANRHALQWMNAFVVMGCNLGRERGTQWVVFVEVPSKVYIANAIVMGFQLARGEVLEGNNAIPEVGQMIATRLWHGSTCRCGQSDCDQLHPGRVSRHIQRQIGEHIQDVLELECSLSTTKNAARTFNVATPRLRGARRLADDHPLPPHRTWQNYVLDEASASPVLHRLLNERANAFLEDPTLSVAIVGDPRSLTEQISLSLQLQDDTTLMNEFVRPILYRGRLKNTAFLRPDAGASVAERQAVVAQAPQLVIFDGVDAWCRCRREFGNSNALVVYERGERNVENLQPTLMDYGGFWTQGPNLNAPQNCRLLSIRRGQ